MGPRFSYFFVALGGRLGLLVARPGLRGGGR